MNSMTVQQRRSKLVKQFEMMIFDELKMDQLEIVFNEMLESEESALSEAQWLAVEDRSAEYKSGKNPGSSWEEVKARIRSNNGV